MARITDWQCSETNSIISFNFSVVSELLKGLPTPVGFSFQGPTLGIHGLNNSRLIFSGFCFGALMGLAFLL